MTGLTVQLRELGYDYKRWLKECFVRALGLTVRLRDEGDLSQAQIEAALSAPDGDDYYLKALEANLEELFVWENGTPEERRSLYDAARSKYLLSAELEAKEARLDYRGLEDSLQAIYRMLNLEHPSDVGPILRLAADQLEQSLEWLPDRSAPAFLEYGKWREERTKALNVAIGHHRKTLAEAEAQRSKNLALYRQFCAVVDAAP